MLKMYHTFNACGARVGTPPFHFTFDLLTIHIWRILIFYYSTNTFNRCISEHKQYNKHWPTATISFSITLSIISLSDKTLIVLVVPWLGGSRADCAGSWNERVRWRASAAGWEMLADNSTDWSTRSAHTASPAFATHYRCSRSIHYAQLSLLQTPCPKISGPLIQTRLIQFIVYGFQRNNRTLHHLNISYGHTHYDVRTLPCVLSVTSLWRQSLFTLRYVLYIVTDKEMKQQRIRLKLKTCVEIKNCHVRLKLQRQVQNDCLNDCFKFCKKKTVRY